MDVRTMWGTVDVDPDTNLPRLPDGLFWKVKKETGSYHRMQLRRVRPFWFSEVVEWTIVRKDQMTKNGLIIQAAYVLYSMTRTFDEILGTDTRADGTRGQEKLTKSYHKRGRA